jgi:hypothetical protein
VAVADLLSLLLVVLLRLLDDDDDADGQAKVKILE